MSLADIINTQKELNAWYEEVKGGLSEYSGNIYKQVSNIAEYLIKNVRSVCENAPLPCQPSIPYGYISTIDFEKKYGIATANTLNSYCRDQELPFNAYTIDPETSQDNRCYWFIHPKRTFDYLLTKKIYQCRIKRGLYKPELKELMD
jgi:hypothetical protein